MTNFVANCGILNLGNQNFFNVRYGSECGAATQFKDKIARVLKNFKKNSFMSELQY